MKNTTVTLITPLAFSRFAAAFTAMWFLILWPTLIWTQPSFFKEYYFDKPAEQQLLPCDFPQYYMGAVAYTTGNLDSLYPRINQDAYSQKSHFKPSIQTPLFDPNPANNPIYFHDTISFPSMSYIDEDLLRLCPEIDQYYRYAYPPPLSILLSPLSYWDIHTASLKVWPTVAVFALFGTAFFSARIHRILRKDTSYFEGLIMLALVIFSYRGRTDIMFSGNVTPILSCLITFVAFAWLRGWQFGIAFAMIPLLLFKSIGLSWTLLLFIHKIQWKTLYSLAFLTITLNGIMIWLGGTALYKTYFLKILPYLNIPAGVGIPRQVLDWFGIYPSKFYLAVTIALLVFLYGCYYINGKNASSVERQQRNLALLSGSMAVYCMLNFSIWLAYFPNYLYFPFLGWLLWEGSQANGKWRIFIFCGAFLGFAICASEWVVNGALSHLFGENAVYLYHNLVFVPSFVLIMPIFFLIISLRRLTRPINVIAPNSLSLQEKKLFNQSPATPATK